jgi:hypothetical protein
MNFKKEAEEKRREHMLAEMERRTNEERTRKAKERNVKMAKRQEQEGIIN